MDTSYDELFASFADLEKEYIVNGTLARKNLPKTSSEVSKMSVRRVSSKRYEIAPVNIEQTPKKVAKKQVAKIIEMETVAPKKEVEVIQPKITKEEPVKQKVESAKEKEKARKKEEKEREKRVIRQYKKLNELNRKRYTRQIREAEEEEMIYEDMLYEQRITQPKKRNIFSRIHNINRYQAGAFEEDEKEAMQYKRGNLTIRDIDYAWEDIQNYEDARDDVALRRGWTAFKVTLAGVALVGALFLAKTGVDHLKNTIFEPKQERPTITSVMDLDEEQRFTLSEKSLAFQNSVANRDGYYFDYLSQAEIAEGYLKISNVESKISERNFDNVSLYLKDQEFLDKILQEAYGVEKFNSFSPEQRRDYKQMAFEMFFETHPKVFNEESMGCIRNPIIMDYISARENAQAKEFRKDIKLNNDQRAAVKNLGSLLHVTRKITPERIQAENFEDGGQAFLQDMLRGIIGEAYDTMSDNDRRVYLQTAYEWLPSNVKVTYFKDPIAIDRENDSIRYANTNDDQFQGR